MNSNIQLALQKKAEQDLTMNQAYKEYVNATGDTSTPFKDFMNKAVGSGWIDQTLNATSSILHSKFGINSGTPLIQDTPCSDGYEKDAQGVCVTVQKTISRNVWIGIGVVVIGIAAVVIYQSKNKK
jgi:hypothetical protein